MPAVQKPTKSTPESRRAEKQKRPPNPLKAQILHREPIRDQDQTPIVKAKPAESNLYRIAGSSLPTISAKRLKTLEGKHLTSTFAPKPGVRRLQHTAMVQGRQIKRVAQRTGRMAPGTKLRPVGVRGKRLAPGDRKQEAISHKLRCICGCNAHLQPGADGVPGKGLISRAHLESRRFEETRNLNWNNLPACAYLAEWLDKGPSGGYAKEALLEMARAKGERLTTEEVQPVLSDHGYYTWLHHERRIL